MNALPYFPRSTWPALAGAMLLAGCVPPPAFDTSPGHITQPAPPVVAPPPAPVKAAPALPPPKPAAPVPTYTVVVNDVPVKDLLFSIARDTQYNIDLHPGISGNVSLNAVQEPLPAILERIARQANLRYEMHGRTVSVMPDTPYVKTYTVNYVNVARNTTSSVGVAAQIASTGGAATAAAGGTGSPGTAGSNSSTTTVASQSNNDLWTVLADNIRTMLAGTRAVTQSSEERAARLEAEKIARAERVSQAEAASKAGQGAAQLFTAAFAGQATVDARHDVAVNPVAGTISVLGTSRQHELVQQYLDRVMQSAQRQVLIEATIVEVTLKDQYRAGIDWKKTLATGASGWSITTKTTSALASSLTPFITATYTNTGSNGFEAAINLLESFGNTKVLSSPKLMALNNQTALLKVVNNLVYFSIDVAQGTVTASGLVLPSTVKTEAHTVPVGVVMSVTPQVGENGLVSLTIRPTITRKVGDVEDPSPLLKQGGLNISNKVPVIQVREMESLLQVKSGQTVILGGLIQDDTNNARDGLPALSRPEGIGALFGQHERVNSQTELVIFLRPIIVSNPTLESEELRQFQRLLPAARSTP
ncbi:MAG: secretin N-terminal domain-containing protein [Pseudomonadota bacterium]